MQVFGLPRQVTRIASLASRPDRLNRDIVAYRRALVARWQKARDQGLPRRSLPAPGWESQGLPLQTAPLIAMAIAPLAAPHAKPAARRGASGPIRMERME